MTKEHEIMYKEVLALLQKYASDDKAKLEVAPLVALKSLAPNHLYQDLGLDNRIQMGKLMKKNFPSLAEKKPEDKLWKKYIYDLIGKVAPACATCSDQVNCFACKV